MVRVTLFILSLCYAPFLLAQQQISFASLDHDKSGKGATMLRGVLYRPDGKGPFPAIVGLHGCAGLFNKNDNVMVRDHGWAAYLRDRGYVVLLVDSFMARKISNVCGQKSSAASPSRERSYDAYGALQYLRNLPFVLSERIGLMGWSHGGGTLLYAVDRLSVARPEDMSGGRFRAAIAFYPGWCRASAHRADWVSDTPLLILIGEKDDWTPAGPCVSFAEQARGRGTRVETIVYPGAYHDFDWPGIPEHSLKTVVTRLGHPTVGTNPAALDDAHKRVSYFFDSHLKAE